MRKINIFGVVYVKNIYGQILDMGIFYSKTI